MKKLNNEKTLQELNLEDDFLFAKVMQDKEICRKVLEKILNVPIKEVTIPSIQRTIDILYEGKGVRLDVYINDDKGTVYNVEMQRGEKKELPKRCRYYQSSLDMDLISAGEPYTTLRKTFIIFICTFDPFTDGRHIYTFENICRENPSLQLGDETTKIFLNTKGNLNDIDNEMEEFLTYVENTTDAYAKLASSSLVKEIHKKVIQIKHNKEMEVEYMTLMQRDREKREEGVELAGKIFKLYSKGLSREDIEAELEVDLDYIDLAIDSFGE
jgi:predicted transposase/invertase (TIGR01784 family)